MKKIEFLPVDSISLLKQSWI